MRRTERAGGLGGFLDPGSGSKLGLEVLSVSAGEASGGRRQGLLTKLLGERCGLTPGQISKMKRSSARSGVAELAKVALEAYALGDRGARSLVRRAVQDLLAMVLDVRAKLALEDRIAVYASGGLFQSPIIRRLFGSGLEQSLPEARLTVIDFPLLHILRLAEGIAT